MIISIRSQADSDECAQLMALLCRLIDARQPISTVRVDGRDVIALAHGVLDEQACALLKQQAAVERLIPIKTPYQLVSRAFKPGGSSIIVGEQTGANPVTIGSERGAPVIIAGPCSVEGREQILANAAAVKAAGAHILRGGVFKPRTSPYQFQGLGLEGLELLAEARTATGLPVITEVMEPGMVETVAQYADILQIGSRNMQNYPLLQAAGRNGQQRPVMLKRGFAATIDEWLLAAEYVVAAGNPNVILCERGIRSFDAHTRNVLDLTCVPLLHELTHLPVIVDPSHATGRRELVPVMSRAAIAAGADGLILEAHPDPDNALSDGRQTITIGQLQRIVRQSSMISAVMQESGVEQAA